MSSIVVLGDINVDIVSLIDGEVHFNSDTSSINRHVVGGSPCNMAAWIAHSSAGVSLIADVGSDFLGDWALAQISAGLIDTRHIKRNTGRTGTCVIIVDNNGQRTMFPDFGANLVVELDQARVQAIKVASVLVMSAYTFMRPQTQTLALQALEIAKASRTRVVIDAASSAPIRSWGADRVRDFLGQADLVLANDDEIAELTIEGHEAWLKSLPNLVIKHGPDGASWWAYGRKRTQLPAKDVVAVDTTGAGDALCGGLVARIVMFADWSQVSDADRKTALDSAIATASECCTHIGAWPQGATS